MKILLFILLTSSYILAKTQDYTSYGMSPKFVLKYRIKKSFSSGYFTKQNQERKFKSYATYDSAGRILTYKEVVKDKREYELSFFYLNNQLDSVTVLEVEYDSIQIVGNPEWEVDESVSFKQYKHHYSGDTTFMLVNKGCLCFCKDNETIMDTAELRINKRNAEGKIYEKVTLDYFFGKYSYYSEDCYDSKGRLIIWNHYYQSGPTVTEAEYVDSADISIHTIKHTNSKGEDTAMVTTYHYNKNGLLTNIMHPDGAETYIGYNFKSLEVVSRKVKAGIKLSYTRTRYTYRLP